MKKYFHKNSKKKTVVKSPASKDGFPDFMKKEIFTAGEIFIGIMNEFAPRGRINFDFLKLKTDRFKRIYITAEHEFYGCALAAAYNFEVLSDLPSSPSCLTEFNCSNPVLDKNTLVIIIAENDRNVPVKTAQKRCSDAKTKVINILASSENCDKKTDGIVLDYDSFSLFPTGEYSAVYFTLCLLALCFSEKCKIVTELYLKIAVKMCFDLKEKVKHIMENDYFVNEISKAFGEKRIVLTGKNVDFSCALYAEKSLSFITKKNAAAVLPEELDFYVFDVENTDFICFVSNRELMAQTLFYTEKYKDKMLLIAPESIARETDGYKNIITYPDSIPLFNPISALSSAQLLIYNILKNNLLETDKPIPETEENTD